MEWARHPIVLIWLTITVYWLTTILRARTGSMFANPVVVGTLVVIEPTRVFRRQFILSHATLADSSNWR
jgi:putative effector of murein hydrolase